MTDRLAPARAALAHGIGTPTTIDAVPNALHRLAETMRGAGKISQALASALPDQGGRADTMFRAADMVQAMAANITHALANLADIEAHDTARAEAARGWTEPELPGIVPLTGEVRMIGNAELVRSIAERYCESCDGFHDPELACTLAEAATL